MTWILAQTSGKSGMAHWYEAMSRGQISAQIRQRFDRSPFHQFTQQAIAQALESHGYALVDCSDGLYRIDQGESIGVAELRYWGAIAGWEWTKVQSTTEAERAIAIVREVLGRFTQREVG